VKSVCHWNCCTIAIKIYNKSMQCLWLRLLWHYRSCINTNMLLVASWRLLRVLRLTFDWCSGFDLFHNNVAHSHTLCASKRRVLFYCKMFQFWKPIYADYFLALHCLAQGTPSFFVSEPLHNSSKTGHLT